MPQLPARQLVLLPRPARAARTRAVSPVCDSPGTGTGTRASVGCPEIIPSDQPRLTMIQPILDKAVAGERLSPEEGLSMIQSQDLAAIGRAAGAVTRRLTAARLRHYNLERN